MSTGYGVDTWCTNRLRSGRLVGGTVLVAQAIYRRLSTPRGTLRGPDAESNYGIDLAEYVGKLGPAAAAAALPGIIRGECRKDDRILDVDVTVVPATDDGFSYSLVVTIVATLQNEGDTFTLTIGVGSLESELLGIAA